MPSSQQPPATPLEYWCHWCARSSSPAYTGVMSSTGSRRDHLEKSLTWALHHLTLPSEIWRFRTWRRFRADTGCSSSCAYRESQRWKIKWKLTFPLQQPKGYRGGRRLCLQFGSAEPSADQNTEPDTALLTYPSSCPTYPLCAQNRSYDTCRWLMMAVIKEVADFHMNKSLLLPSGPQLLLRPGNSLQSLQQWFIFLSVNTSNASLLAAWGLQPSVLIKNLQGREGAQISCLKLLSFWGKGRIIRAGWNEINFLKPFV